MAPRRNWVGLLRANPLASGGLALALVIALVGVGVAVKRSGDGETTPLAVGTEASPAPGTTFAPGESPIPGATVSPAATAPTLAPGETLPPGVTVAPPPPGAVKEAPGCVPRQPRAANGKPETGITNSTITVGQIVSDSSNLPQQLKPVYEGLSTYVKQVNESGGVCRRKLEIRYENDNAFPATHRFEQLAQEVFAFVGSHSLIESVDYETSPPFNPEFRDEATNEFVPDIGGLAFSYNRSQSPWYAGAIGSISPVLIGGGAFKQILDIARADGRPCSLNGIVYLIEPTGAAEDQAQLLQIALEADWGGQMPGRVRLYQQNLAQPVAVHRGIVQAMIRDGVDCSYGYMDLQSNINLVVAMHQEGIWPPGKCTRANKSECMDAFVQPLASYDPKFIRDVEAQAPGASKSVLTFVPNLPLNETANPAMRSYIDALARCTRDLANYPGCRDAEPAFFGILGYVTGILFVDAVRSCGPAPTRRCVMSYLRTVKNFTGGGLLGPVTPFRCTRARDGSSHNWGVYCWKWIFNHWVTLRVEGNEKNLIQRFHRVQPARGFSSDTIRVARGTPA